MPFSQSKKARCSISFMKQLKTAEKIRRRVHILRLKKDEICGIINMKNKLDTEPLITHTYPLSKIDEAYELFENKRDGVIKVAVEC